MKNDTIQERKKRPFYAEKENTEYEDLAEHIRTMMSKEAVTFIPELALKLKKKYLDESQLTEQEIRLRNRQIEDRLIDEWGDNKPWATSTIYIAISRHASWVKNPNQVKSAKANQNLLSAHKKREGYIKQLDKVLKPVQEPPKPVPSEITDDSQIIRRLDDEPLFRKLGEGGKSVLTRYGDIFGPAQDLIEGITGQRIIPNAKEDRFDEYIKPSREEFMTVYHEVDERMRVSLYNALVYIGEIVEDRIRLIDGARRK